MEEELITHIKNQLTDYDLDYRDGAWEAFQQKREKHRKLILWRKLRGVAAALLIAILLVPVKLAVINTGKKPDANTAAVVIAASPIVKARKAVQINKGGFHTFAVQAVDRSNDATRFISSPDDIGVTAKLSAGEDGALNQANRPEAAKKASQQPKAESPKTISTPEFLAHETADNSLKTQGPPAARKWGFAFSFGKAVDSRAKSDFSFGTHITYAVNKRLLISSGIFFNQLGGKKDNDLPDMAGRQGKFITGSEAHITGIDIPLELQFKASKQLYARVGVSAYNIISQRQTLNYSEQKMSETTFVDASGNMKSEMVTTTEVYTETVPEVKLKQYKFVGLYNISVGFQQRISPRNTLALEPYIKIPLSGYSDQHVNLVQGGLRVKVDF